MSSAQPGPVVTVRLVRGLLALLAGVVTGATLATIGIGSIGAGLGRTLSLMVVNLLGKSTAEMTTIEIVIIWRFALVYGAIIAVICAILWWGLARLGRANLVTAMLLGFAVSLLFGCLTSWDPTMPLQCLLRSGLVGLAGAVAALVTWRLGRPFGFEGGWRAPSGRRVG